MKKVKYLIGCLVVGLGLLFNQSFGYDNYLYVDLVSIENHLDSSLHPIAYGNYLYTFENFGFGNNLCLQGSNTCNTTSNHYNDFGYSSYYNGVIHYNDLPYRCGSDNTVPSCDGREGRRYNKSVFGLNLYTGWQTRPSSSYSIYYNNNKTHNYGPIRISFGIENNFGNNFIYVGDVSYSSIDIKSPVFGFGQGFFTNNNFITVDNGDTDYVRFLYESSGSGSDYLNTFEYYDPVYMSGFNTGGTILNSYWEYFYQRGTRTNYGYIVDDGSMFSKYKHFGLFGLGYSYVYSTNSVGSTGVNWNQIKFKTVSDNIIQYLSRFGDVSYETFNDYDSSYTNLSYNGILLLRPESYTTLDLGGVYLLYKDPVNYGKVMYEHWSCDSSNIDNMIGNKNGCTKIDGGYLTYNNSTNILPFNSLNYSTYFYDLTTLDSNFPFLYDLYNGGNLSSVHGINRLNNSCLYLNNSSRCYGFTPDSSVNIISAFLDTVDNPLIDPAINQELMAQYCFTDVNFYLSNVSFCGQYGWNFGTIEMSGSNYTLTTVCVESGSETICYDKLIPADTTGNVYVDENGQTYYISDNPYVSMLGTTGSMNYVSGFLDSDGLLSLDYFKSLFGTGRFFFSCPYPYVDTFGFISKIKIGNFYPLMPINCFVSAFRVGNTIHYFDDYGVFPTSYGSGLLYGNTKYHKTLFRFFDVLLSFGIFILLSSLVRLFSKK